MKRKWWVLAQLSLLPVRKLEAVTQSETKEKDHPMRKITQGAGIINDYEDKQDHGYGVCYLNQMYIGWI